MDVVEIGGISGSRENIVPKYRLTCNGDGGLCDSSVDPSSLLIKFLQLDD